LLVFGCWFLVFGFWFLVFGFWFLVFVCWYPFEYKVIKNNRESRLLALFNGVDFALQLVLSV
ncbi:MAG: hypothetical protein R3Y34_07375, partial [Rikenellaceae bacterium]